MKEPEISYSQAWDKMSSSWQHWQDLIKLPMPVSQEERDIAMIKLQEAEKAYNEAQMILESLDYSIIRNRLVLIWCEVRN